jgi:phosphofructokinase-like protein
MKKIGVLTGGADCPGMNSVIRAVVRKAMNEGCVVSGIKKGWNGLIDDDMRILDLRLTSGILDRGGTILGTSRMVAPLGDDSIKKIKQNFKRNGLDAVIAVGGEDTLKIALQLMERINLPVVGVPKSIDNALWGTDYAFGFDTAVNIATECIDRLHTTAESHHRIVVIEVMGKYTGWIALEAGIAGGADIILVPEFPAKIEEVCETLKARHKRGKSFTIIVVAEGAKIDGHCLNDSKDAPTKSHRLSHVGELLRNLIIDKTGYETRVSVLGHIQRGGTPTAYDRILGTRFGFKAVELVLEKKFGKMVSLHDNKIHSWDISDTVKRRKCVDQELYEMSKIFSV